MTVVQSAGALIEVNRPTRPGLIRGAVELYDGETADYATLWRTQPNIRLVTGFLARNIAQLGLHGFTAVTDDERRRIDRAHPMARLIRRPNPYTTRYAFMDALIHDLKVFDRFYALKTRNNVTDQLVMFRIPPYMVTPVGDNWIVPDGFEVRGSRGIIELDRDQVVDIHGYNPSDARVGASPIETLRRILAEDAAAVEYREQYLRSGARVSGVIERPIEAPRWSDTARKRFRSDFQSLYAGARGELAGATPILEEGMQWKEASFSPRDSEYFSMRRLTREEVAAQYYVSPLFVGILDNANFSNVAEQHKHLYQDTLGPDLVHIEEEWDRQILPEFPDLDQDRTYVEFNLAEKLKGTFEEQAAVIQTMVGAPVMSRNEGRSRLNLPPVDGGDQLVTPLNVLIGGQASPSDSAPPLGAASRRRGQRALPAKAAGLPSTVTGWHAKHVEIVSSFLDRQKDAVVSRLGAGQAVDEAWDEHRWNTELGDDLYALAVTMAAEVGADVAGRYGGTYDQAVTLGYLRENARIAAEGVNSATKDELAASYTAATAARAGFASRAAGTKTTTGLDPLDDTDEEEPPDPLDVAAGVFTLAALARTDQIATSRVTAVGGFASHEGARQSGVTSKVWRVNSARPRADHPADGETVGLDDVFSNGGRWPGDAAAGIDQTAGCTCSLEFSTEEP